MILAMPRWIAIVTKAIETTFIGLQDFKSTGKVQKYLIKVLNMILIQLGI